jgi:SEFIR domain.
MEKTKSYTVFISYSWTSPEHEQWVYDLAVRLMENGIDVKLDKWDLKPGQDKYAFMESMVQDPNIDRVLMICERGYKAKADSRVGGVGTETQIITPEIYDKVNQSKFIPVIAEQGEHFDSFMPTYLKARIAIDLSTPENYEAGYEQLLRLIAERPMYRKPSKGQLPSFLFEEEKEHFKTTNLVKQLKNFLLNKPEKANYVIHDFIQEFTTAVNGFKIEYSDFKEPFDEQIYNSIKDMQPLRNDYIEFLSLLCNSGENFDIDIVIRLFEDMYCYTEFQESGTYNKLQFDHYKFFITELFLYTVTILLEHGLHEKLNTLIYNRYFVKSRRNKEQIAFDEFRFYSSSLDELRKSRLNLNRVSLTADLLVQRSVINNKSYKEKLIDADLLLYYISAACLPQNKHCWFPITYIYLDYRKVEILQRLTSKRHFEKVKILFNIKTKEEMQSLIEKFSNPYNGYSSSFDNIPDIKNHIKSEEVCVYA